MKTYEIGGMNYRMDELVLDQEEALADLLEPLYADGETTAQGLVKALLVKKLLKKALAIVLTREGDTAEIADRQAVEAHLGRHLTLSQQAQVVRDFFEVNASALEQLKGLAANAQAGAAGSRS